MTRLMAMVVGLSSTVVGGCVGYFGPAGAGGASDVPCFTPAEWSGDIIDFANRTQDLDGDALLFTVQTLDQALTDVEDGSKDFVPHQAVYRFDPTSGDFGLVTDVDWETAGGEVCDRCPDFEDEGSFLIEDGTLRFNGRDIPVAGRRARNIFDAGISNCMPFDEGAVSAIAVLSFDGNEGLLGDTAGQHYHELFSKGDGTQLGRTVRLGIEGGSINGCWVANEKYVIYHYGTREIPIAARICVVPVADDLAGLKGQ